MIVSPLVSLMEDQVDKLRKLGISAVFLSDIKDEEIKEVDEGCFSLVYGSPEAWLKNERWRKMLSSDMCTRPSCVPLQSTRLMLLNSGKRNIYTLVFTVACLYIYTCAKLIIY